MLLPVAVFLLGALAPPTKFAQHTVGRSRAIHLAAETATTEVEPPSVAQCLEASFVPAVMAMLPLCKSGTHRMSQGSL